MIRLFSTTSALALSVFLSTSAQSSDLFGGSAKDTPSEVVSYKAPLNWGGLYVGGSVGYGIATETYEGSPFGYSFESPILTAVAGFDIARGRFVFGPFAEYTYITADEVEDINDWAVGLRAGVVVAPRTLLYGTAAYAQLSDDDDNVDGFRAGLGTEFAATDNIFIDTKVNYTWYDLEDGEDAADAGDLRAMIGLKIKLNSGVFGN